MFRIKPILFDFWCNKSKRNCNVLSDGLWKFNSNRQPSTYANLSVLVFETMAVNILSSVLKFRDKETQSVFQYSEQTWNTNFLYWIENDNHSWEVWTLQSLIASFNPHYLVISKSFKPCDWLNGENNLCWLCLCILSNKQERLQSNKLGPYNSVWE